MIRRIFFPLGVVGLVLLIVVSVSSAVAASNMVPQTRLSDTSRGITANDLKPAQCAGLNLSSIVACSSGNCNGTAANELILGYPGFEIINGGGGADCIIASTTGLSICERISGQEVFINCSLVF